MKKRQESKRARSTWHDDGLVVGLLAVLDWLCVLAVAYWLQLCLLLFAVCDFVVVGGVSFIGCEIGCVCIGRWWRAMTSDLPAQQQLFQGFHVGILVFVGLVEAAIRFDMANMN